MTHYLLRPGEPQCVRRGDATIRVHAQDESPHLKLLVGHHETLTELHQLRSDLYYLALPGDAAVLYAAPTAGGPFPLDAHYSFKMDIGQASGGGLAGDSIQFTLEPGKLAGQSRAAVLRFGSTDTMLEVELLGPVEHAESMTPRSEIAALGLSAARQTLGTEDVPQGQRVEVVVVVDTSASMQPHFASGVVARLMELLDGMAMVISPENHCVPALTPPGSGSLGPAWDSEELQGGRPSVSIAPPLSRAVPERATDGPARMVLIVTDAVPYDLAALAGQATPTDHRHLLLLGVTDPGEPGPVAASVCPEQLNGPHGSRLVAHLLRSHQSLLSA